MPVQVTQPIGLTPFVQETMKQNARTVQSMGTVPQMMRRDEEIRQLPKLVGFVGVDPVILPRAPTFSDKFGQDMNTLGDKLRAALKRGTPASKQTFWSFDTSTDVSTNASESGEEEEEKDDEVKSQYDSEYEAPKAEDDDDDVRSQYSQYDSEYEDAKAEIIKRAKAHDPNTRRIAAMEAVHQPVPGVKSGRDKASMKEYLRYHLTPRSRR